MIAEDVMTMNPRTILNTDSVGDALELLATLEIRHLPVVDQSDTLVGMVSDRDLGRLMRSFDEVEGRSVSEYMSADVVSVEEDADLREVIETLLENRIGAVPVVDGDGKIAGIISYVDLLRTYAGELEPGVKGAAASKKAAAAQKPKKKAAAQKKTPAKKQTAGGKKKASTEKATKRAGGKKTSTRAKSQKPKKR